MNQDIVNFLMKNPEVLEKLKRGEASLLSIPNSLIPAVIEIFNNKIKLGNDDPAWRT
ncbi:competence pheromone ComX [Bacillus sp. L381]|uniref:competence pheromone ComX n=1 Tax=Bacillus TaxID=1386 RepID=UPI001BAAD9CF|nr:MULTISPECIES: competence pheromone ComX [Bacillus]MCR9039298.1 competence pheromone ComX [Bacillus velezensis]QUN08840.1 competence pheromone ComX [Bacillus amyloliquefaciens]QYM81914.1 competence pheromone ComX [Bacillus sp. 7D3]QZY11147.1 competence pheromone ComX [Bacillus amyloliquefaciens]WIX20962.1 competence pheromone ComX [Bacillus sp. L381]